jgi:hypothetical protein
MEHPLVPKIKSRENSQGSSEASFIRIRNITRIISRGYPSRAITLSLSVQLRSRRHIYFEKRSEANWHTIPDLAPTNETTRRYSQWLPPVLTYVLYHLYRTSPPALACAVALSRK